LRPTAANLLTNIALILVGKEPANISLNNGITICAPRNLPLIEIVSEIFTYKVYTPNDLCIAPNDIVLDIGANIGVFSLYASLSTQNLIYAFEPFTENIKYIKRNAKQNFINNIIINEYAISDRTDIMSLSLTRNPAGNILHTKDLKKSEKTSVDILSKTLEQIIEENNLKQIDFLKMDCEGSEGAIFMSTSKRYLQRIKKISLEFHDNVSALNHHQIQELLKDAGFSTWLNWNGRGPFGYIYGSNL
jgi:FkbM family methyltransferase